MECTGQNQGRQEETRNIITQTRYCYRLNLLSVRYLRHLCFNRVGMEELDMNDGNVIHITRPWNPWVLWWETWHLRNLNESLIHFAVLVNFKCEYREFHTKIRIIFKFIVKCFLNITITTLCIIYAQLLLLKYWKYIPISLKDSRR